MVPKPSQIVLPSLFVHKHMYFVPKEKLLTFAWPSMILGLLDFFQDNAIDSFCMQKTHIYHYLLTLGVFVIDYFYVMYINEPRRTDLNQAVIPAWFPDHKTVKSSKTFEWNKERLVGSSYFCYIRAIFFWWHNTKCLSHFIMFQGARSKRSVS